LDSKKLEASFNMYKLKISLRITINQNRTTVTLTSVKSIIYTQSPVEATY